MSAEFAFWLSLVVVSYPSLIYPVLLLLLRALIHRPVLKQAIEPSVSLLIPAFNEAEVIKSKITNALDSDYPDDLLEIIVASDGSTDDTVIRARRLEDGKRVRVLAYPVNRGKVSTLNDAVPELKGEIVVFSDATAMLSPDAIRHLASNFADETVGAVSAAHKLLRPDAAAIGTSEDLYWRYEAFLRELESGVASVSGGHGSLYAVRKALYPYPAAGTINDDFVIPMRILQRGYRVVYEPRAVVREEAGEMSGFARRVRIMAGNIQQLSEVKSLVWPPRFLQLFFFLSHKACRLAVPFFMMALFLLNALLLERPLYQVMFAFQLVFYTLAGLGAVRPLQPRVLRLPHYFCMTNAAGLVAIFNAAAGRRAPWK